MKGNFCVECGQRLNPKYQLCERCNKSEIKKKMRKKKTKIVFAVLCPALMICAVVSFFVASQQKTSNASVNYNSFAEGFTSVLIVDEESAIEAISTVADNLGIQSPQEELKVVDINEVGGNKFYRVQQYYSGIPVYGRTVVVSADSKGNALALTANFKNLTENIQTIPMVSQTEAESSIKEYFDVEDINVQSLGSDNLVIYAPENRQAVLAYSLLIDDSIEIVINALTGKVIKVNDNINNVSAQIRSHNNEVTGTGWRNSDGSYHLYNDEYKIEVFDVDGIITTSEEGTVHTDFKKYGIDTLYSETNIFDENAIILMNDVISIADYFEDLGFKGFDRIHLAINDSYQNGSNARGGGLNENGVDKAIMLMGSQYDFDEKDVTAHEFTHGVTGLLVNWDEESLENNALLEAYSDIFGILYEDSVEPDWRMIHLSEVLRDLSDPTSTGHLDNTSDIENSNEDDYHYQMSTIISHCAYLMWNGLDGSSDRCIDTDDLAELWYQSLLLLQSDADFSQCRNAVELAGRIMLRNKDITSVQYETITDAFKRVGIQNAAYTVTQTVKNEFDLVVQSHNGNDSASFKLEVVKMPWINYITGFFGSAKTVVKKTVTSGEYHLELGDGVYTIRLMDDSDTFDNNEVISIKIVVDGDGIDAVDKVTLKTDFSDIITVVLNSTVPNEYADMVNTVMSELEMWEMSDGKNAVLVELQEISGDYNICVGYSDDVSVESDEAVYSFTCDYYISYHIRDGVLTEIEGGSPIMPGEELMWGGIGNGRHKIGVVFWNVTKPYSAKLRTMNSLFSDIKFSEDE